MVTARVKTADITATQSGVDNAIEMSADEQFERLAQRALYRLDWCKASDDRRKSENRWRDAQNFWLGKHWDGIKSFGIKGRNPESKDLHPNPVDNYFKAHVEGLVGDITDRPADIQIRPREDADEAIASKMGRVIDYLWYANKGDRKLEFAVRRGVLYGPLIAKIFWDNSWQGTPSNPFVGDVRFITVLPSNLFIDPRVKAVEEGAIQQAEFLIYGVKRSMTYVQEMYPDKGHLVQPDTYAAYVSTLTGEGGDDDGPDNADTEVLVVEYWYKGKPQAPEYPVMKDREIPEKVISERWVHKAVIAGGVLLEHRTYTYPKYPFVMEWIYTSDESIYGYGDAHDILMPQLIINKLNEISLEGAVLLSQGNWLTEEGNIRNKNQFQMYAGMGGSVLPVVDVGRTTRVHGGNVPGSLFAHYRQELSAMETVSGRYDVAQGRTPRNVQAASAIALLLQQAGGRVRQRSRAVASFVEQTVAMMVDLAGKYYTEERLIRVIGTNNAVTHEPISRMDFLKTKVWLDPLTGQESLEEYIPEMDVIVRAGIDTPMSKAYYSEMAMQLFSAGVIDEIALLDVLQFPHWRTILARKQGLQQQQQAQAAPQAAPTGVAPTGAAPPPTGAGGLPPELMAALAGGGGGVPAGMPAGMPPEMVGQAGQGAIPPELLQELMAAQMAAQAAPPVDAGSPNEREQMLALMQMLQQQGL